MDSCEQQLEYNGNREWNKNETFIECNSCSTIAYYSCSNELESYRENNSITNLCNQEDAEIRMKLRWFFTNPFEKYRKKKLHPWKLFFQIFKIILITIQILTYSSTQNNLIITNESIYKLAYETFASNDGISKSLDFYTPNELIKHIKFVYEKYSNVDKYLFSPFKYPQNKNFKLCIYSYSFDIFNEFFEKEKYLINQTKDCMLIDNLPTLKTSLHQILIQPQKIFFQSIDINFLLLTEIFTEKLKIPKKYCFLTDIKISYKNVYNNGEIKFIFTLDKEKYYCGDISNEKIVKIPILCALLNISIVTLAVVSLIACIRSLLSHFKLMNKVTDYFSRVKHINLDYSEKMIFFNFWILLIIIGDVFAIVGSLFKIIIDFSEVNLHQETIILLGIACIIVWIGALRYLTYFQSYNALLIIIKLSFPTLCRFLVCVLFLFIGFTFFGYILLAPYHEKFRTLCLTIECLFSLMIGDEIYVTFQNTKTQSKLILLISQIYLAIFNIIFLYLVVTIFISIVCHYHEYHIETKNTKEIRSFIDEFIEQCKCSNCDITFPTNTIATK